MIKQFLYHHLLKAILFALIALVLYGVFPGTGLAAILITFAGLRFVYLATDAMRKPMTDERWDAMVDQLTRIHEQRTPDERSAEAIALKLAPHTAIRELARTRVNNAMRSYVPPRP